MAPGKIQTTDVHDIFQSGLVRGVERSRLNPRKQYFYVEHPEEGWRVYLRAACFIHDWADAGNRERFLVVKRTGGDPDKKVWEMPKGQMEGKDAGGGDGGRQRPLMQLLKENMRREVAEEAKIHHVREMHHTGLVLQSVEPDYPAGSFFQYHVFSGYAHPNQVRQAEEEFAWLAEHPDAFRRLRSDQREKDAIAWYGEEGSAKKMMGRWSPTLLRLYLDKGGGV